MIKIYHNATIYTGDLPFANAMAVCGTNILACGSLAQVTETAIARHPEKKVTYIDMDGHFICAGFNDSHMHLLNFGQSLHMIPMAECTDSLAHLIRFSRDYLSKNPVAPGQWLTGRGFNQDYFTDEKRIPTRFDLDHISTEIPICATRCCGHCLVVNSKALELVDLQAHTDANGQIIQPEGGQISMQDGAPNGQFFDNALSLVHDVMPTPDKALIKSYIQKALTALNSYGITSSQTDDYCVFNNVPPSLINECYRELEDAGLLTVRIFEQCNFDDAKKFKEFVKEGNVTDKCSNHRFKIGPLKMLGDGSLGARTAYLSKPYADAPDNQGLPIFTQETFDEMIGFANAYNMPVAVHSIGDGCLDRVLNAIEKALNENPHKNHRHGIVHCQITRKDQLERIAKLGLHVFAQTIFLDYDIHIVQDRVGEELAASSYNFKTLKELGATVSNGSDCPVELPDVMKGIQCAVTRKTISGMGPYLPDEAFSVQEAIDSYTSGSAYASFEENHKGKLLPGFVADFVVLEKNPFESTSEEIHKIKILETYLDGERVFQA